MTPRTQGVLQDARSAARLAGDTGTWPGSASCKMKPAAVKVACSQTSTTPGTTPAEAHPTSPRPTASSVSPPSCSPPLPTAAAAAAASPAAAAAAAESTEAAVEAEEAKRASEAEAEAEREHRRETAQRERLSGNDAFAAGDVAAAARHYSAAMQLRPADPTMPGNRCLCQLRLGCYAAALQDACLAQRLSQARILTNKALLAFHSVQLTTHTRVFAWYGNVVRVCEANDPPLW